MAPEEVWFPAALDILWLFSSDPQTRGGKKVYRCEKRLRKKKNKEKETQTKKRFSLILKVTFLLLALGMWAWEAGTGGGEGLLLSFLVTSRPNLPGAAGCYPLRVVLPWGPGALVCLPDHQQAFVQRTIFKEIVSNKDPLFLSPPQTHQTDPQTHSQGRAREEGAAEMKGWAGCWAGSASLLDPPS